MKKRSAFALRFSACSFALTGLLLILLLVLVALVVLTGLISAVLAGAGGILLVFVRHV
jgi:hypothetical protein